MAEKIYVKCNGCTDLLSRFCHEYEINFSTVYRRWKCAGEPQEIADPDSFFKPAKFVDRGGYTVDGVHYDTSIKLGWALDMSPMWVKTKFQQLGRREATREELFAKKERTVRVSKDKSPANYAPEPPPVDKSVDDPSWKRMSSTRNTGAGKGEIQNEEWLAMRRTRNSMAQVVIHMPR